MRKREYHKTKQFKVSGMERKVGALSFLSRLALIDECNNSDDMCDKMTAILRRKGVYSAEEIGRMINAARKTMGWMFDELIFKKKTRETLTDQVICYVQDTFEPTVIFGGKSAYECKLSTMHDDVDIFFITDDANRDLDKVVSYITESEWFSNRTCKLCISGKKKNGIYNNVRCKVMFASQVNDDVDICMLEVDTAEHRQRIMRETNSDKLSVALRITERVDNDMVKCVGIDMSKKYMLWVNLNKGKIPFTRRTSLDTLRICLDKTCMRSSCKSTRCWSALEQIFNFQLFDLKYVHPSEWENKSEMLHKRIIKSGTRAFRYLLRANLPSVNEYVEKVQAWVEEHV